MAAWGLGRLGPVTLRPAEAWVGDEGEREVRVTERKRGTDWAMGLRVGRQAGLAKQIGDEGAGR